MTEEKKQVLTTKVEFTSRMTEIPKRWLWYLAKHNYKAFSAFALIAKDIDTGVFATRGVYDADSACFATYILLRILTDDIKWIADAYEADKGKPFPVGEFEAPYLNLLQRERLAKECPEAFSRGEVQ